MSSEVLDRSLVLDAVRVTEIAAIAAWKLVGRGDEKEADQAAVDAMRTALNDLDIDGEIVIGEGERDEAPMLYIGEKVGKGGKHKIDIALDPLEGTTLTAKAMANALAVMAWAPKGTMLNAPDTYMDKIACGPGYPAGVIDLDKSPADNVKALAKAKGVEPSEITVCILDRPRHAEIIASVRSSGARVYLITDGDVAGVMNTADAETGVDLYLGQGGPQRARRARRGRSRLPAERARHLHGQAGSWPRVSRRRDRPRQKPERQRPRGRRGQGGRTGRHHRLRARPPAPCRLDRRTARARLRGGADR